MADPIHNFAAELDSPAWDAAAVTPADSALARFPTRGLYIGGGGDVAVYMAGRATDTAVVFVAQAGAILPIRVDHVRATSTTATSIVALY